MILVTGGLGFIGSHTVRALLDIGETVVATRHRNSTPPSFLRDAPGLVIEALDASDAGSWEAIGERHTISGIVHLASGSADAGPLALVDSAAASMRQAIDAATRWRVRLTMASTIGIYAGSVAEGQLREDAGLNLAVPFGIPAAKKVMEVFAAVARSERGLDVVSLRLPAVYGPLGNPESRFFALPELAHAAAGRRPAALPIPMHADNAIDVCYVADVARGIALIQTATTLSHNVYNIGSGTSTANQDVAAALTELRPGFHVGSALLPGRDTDPSVLDISRIRQDVRFVPQISLDEGLSRYLNWLEAGDAR